ncbi:unnamed protein product [Didymodactylos carnosus]|uniref:Uncharacterized protein n=1 Tax=Didymodactylos carnosus TaxID=1234261 RepID=A0A815IPK9_9BILA|nr:unnamed protein product [Didymodactylos carnosus]CAF4252551.1 unnamed protein product [Didymodactylos carnosus]
MLRSVFLHSDRSKKLGFNEYIQSDPCKFEHHDLFKYLQTATLDFQLSDLNCSLKNIVHVRHCLRYLYSLSDLLVRAEQNFMMDPQLLHYSYVHCVIHVSGIGSDSNIATISVEERVRFNEIKGLKQFLEQQVTNFRVSFPFGRPDGAIKATLSLLERVLTKDTSTPTSRDEMTLLRTQHTLVTPEYQSTQT